MNKKKVIPIALVCLLFITPFFSSASSDPYPNDITLHELEGLEKPAEILVDEWGIPHIYASSTDDVYFAQGFNVARDRLWQIDLWRKNGLGELSEVLGPEYIEQDKAKRLFLYRGDMEEEWDAYGPDTEEIVTSFTDGINAYIEMIEEDPDLLPEEFKVLDYEPSKWEPEDVVRIRSHGLTRNVNNEVARALTLREHGEEVESVRKRLQPEWETTVPEGLDLDDISEDILETYRLGTRGVSFDNAGNEIAFEDIETQLTAGNLNDQIEYESALGSNNWVISPEKSETGRPIMADDPHRAVDVPSLRYITHLSAPGLDVIGGGEPVLPGISIGHNGTSAWGLTIFSIDQEDLYVYETNPDNPSEYQYEGDWEEMTSITEEIEVKGVGEKVEELEFTRHGPVIYKDKENNRAFAVKAAWLEPGMAPYLGGLSYMGAESWDEFYEAMNKWGSPSENQVYADVNGDIGWKPGGLTPVRENWDGLLPVPGDGTYEWDGFLDQNKLPYELNPERGWIGTANEMNLPDDYDYEKYKLGFEWSAPFRYQRIEEFMESNEKIGIQDSLQLQTDYTSVPGQRITGLLDDVLSSDEKVNKALDLLREWDGELSVETSAGALFEVWYQQFLRDAVVGAILPEEAANHIGSGDPVVTLDLLENPDDRFGENPEETRDQILLSTLADAIDHMEELLGPDMNDWQWGDLKHAYLDHPLSDMVDEAQAEKMNIGPLPRGGSGDTVGASGYNSDFQQTHGATFRLVVDVGEWDNSIAMNSPGQSGDPDSKFYDNLFEKWANDEAIPLLYSRDKIEEATDQRIILLPESENSAVGIQTLVEHFEEEGEFTGDDAPYHLKLHLTAVNQYENQGDAEKVVKHMEGFKFLLDYQKDNELLSEFAYNTLMYQADNLIAKWE
ncbi:penicillin acylase family protein [Virgibacillus sp. YIM 98842]|uniref:penicillin acylase family protein n=1 Tax=Virgibacillus sp. YIM 98842 TaxID=2663533 RepID=UPI0013DAD357|nr:penicillin acylase family protein [Virgibacillus sp. YIM 98842]